MSTKTTLSNRAKAYESISKYDHKDKEIRKLKQINEFFVLGETDEYIHDFDQPFISHIEDNDHKVSIGTLVLKTRTLFRKDIRFSRLPLMLSIMLQRKALNPLTGIEIKRNQYISFPMTLDVAPYCSMIKTNATYILQSVIVHEGNADNGHFSIFTRSTENNLEWKWISDSTVSSVTNISDVFKYIKAYMLLYRKY
jgi:hypothetical protein